MNDKNLHIYIHKRINLLNSYNYTKNVIFAIALILVQIRALYDFLYTLINKLLTSYSQKIHINFIKHIKPIIKMVKSHGVF